MYNDVDEGYWVAFFTAWAIDVNVEWGLVQLTNIDSMENFQVYNTDVCCCCTVLQTGDAILIWVEDGAGNVGCNGKQVVIWF